MAAIQVECEAKLYLILDIETSTAPENMDKGTEFHYDAWLRLSLQRPVP